MKEIIALIIIYLIFLLYSIALYKKAFNIDKKWLYFFIPVYLLSIYLYFELMNYVHIFLRHRRIYFDFGHASLMLIVLLLLAYLTAIILIILFIIRNRNHAIRKK